MNSELISIIVPVYNVEDYLKECAASILAQSYDNFEVIFVDDGSTDSSGEICDTLANLDERVRIIHQENRGLSGARNRGIEEAKGDYICFIDSDDMIRFRYLEELYSAIKAGDAVMAFCDIESAKLAEPAYSINEKVNLGTGMCKKWLSDFDSREYVLMVVACNKLFSKKLFENVRFESGKWHEDEFAINELIYKIKTAVYVPKKLYFYRQNEKSITGKNNKNSKRHMDIFDAYAGRIEKAIENNDTKFANITLKNSLYKLSRMYFENPELASEAKKRFRQMMENYGEILSKKQKLKYDLFLKFPKSYAKLFRII